MFLVLKKLLNATVKYNNTKCQPLIPIGIIKKCKEIKQYLVELHPSITIELWINKDIQLQKVGDILANETSKTRTGRGKNVIIQLLYQLDVLLSSQSSQSPQRPIAIDNNRSVTGPLINNIMVQPPTLSTVSTAARALHHGGDINIATTHSNNHNNNIPFVASVSSVPSLPSQLTMYNTHSSLHSNNNYNNYCATHSSPTQHILSVAGTRYNPLSVPHQLLPQQLQRFQQLPQLPQLPVNVQTFPISFLQQHVQQQVQQQMSPQIHYLVLSNNTM